ncbi:MAG: SRPBCC family protein, partial [Acidimicrobiia bacterium]
MGDLAELHLTRSATVAAEPLEAYAMLADLTRMGEWSPVCKVCTWDDGAGP